MIYHRLFSCTFVKLDSKIKGNWAYHFVLKTDRVSPRRFFYFAFRNAAPDKQACVVWHWQTPALKIRETSSKTRCLGGTFGLTRPFFGVVDDGWKTLTHPRKVLWQRTTSDRVDPVGSIMCTTYSCIGETSATPLNCHVTKIGIISAIDFRVRVNEVNIRVISYLINLK